MTIKVIFKRILNWTIEAIDIKKEKNRYEWPISITLQRCDSDSNQLKRILTINAVPLLIQCLTGLSLGKFKLMTKFVE